MNATFSLQVEYNRIIDLHWMMTVWGMWVLDSQVLTSNRRRTTFNRLLMLFWKVRVFWIWTECKETVGYQSLSNTNLTHSQHCSGFVQIRSLPIYSPGPCYNTLLSDILPVKNFLGDLGFSSNAHVTYMLCILLLFNLLCGYCAL